jgi:hypothetical protein
VARQQSTIRWSIEEINSSHQLLPEGAHDFLMSGSVFPLHRPGAGRAQDTRGPRNVGQNISVLDGSFFVGFRDHRLIDVWQYCWRRKDPGEGTIADAQITLTNLDDHAQRNTSADSNGGFEFVNLKPEHYEPVVHADGFSEYKVSRGLGQPSFREMGNLTKTPIVQIALARASGC